MSTTEMRKLSLHTTERERERGEEESEIRECDKPTTSLCRPTSADSGVQCSLGVIRGVGVPILGRVRWLLLLGVTRSLLRLL